MMPQYQLPYGKGICEFDIPADRFDLEWIEPPFVPAAADPIEIVRRALANPVDGLSLSDFRGARSVVIAVNDKTRPVPHEHLLPPLLELLHANGISQEAVSFAIATGTHLPMPPSEYYRVLPESIYSRYTVFSHNCDDEANLVSCGTTSRGTQVWANRAFLQADLRIVVGNIEPHHFAGFSGGYKTAAIGLVGRKTINNNHAMLTEPGSRMALFDDNPLRQDIEEIGETMGVHFALNAILNGEKKIVQAVWGTPPGVMRAGIPISRQVCETTAAGKFDIVIASAGGAPKDINFYQSQKALTHASLFTRDGGVMILAAACPEGSGNLSYEKFMDNIHSPEAVFEKFRQMGFVVGPHKAFQVARDAARVKIVLLSEMDSGLVSRLLMTPASSMEKALQYAGNHISGAVERPRIAILPRATNTIPAIG
jgi:lactate racemase